MICEPRPDNAVRVVQVTPEFWSQGIPACVPPPDEEMYKAWDFYIFGKWGETTDFGANTQWGMRGDYICQDRTDPSDVWVVKRKIFENTYAIKG